MIHFVLGGARSGKSQFAEKQAIASEKQLIYIATSEARDDAMARRIKKHQQSRSKDAWETCEEPIHLADIIEKYNDERYCILVDCLTLWLSNCLFDEDKALWQKQKQLLLSCLPNIKAQLLVVSNETGLGVVPMGQITRDFVDEAGLLHQDIAQLANQVTFVVAGLPQVLKS